MESDCHSCQIKKKTPIFFLDFRKIRNCQISWKSV